MNQKKSDVAQFELLTFVHMRKLFRLACARVGNSSDAEDIVQETYIKAFKAFGSFRNEASIETWLIRILINTSSDFLRNAERSKRSQANLLRIDLRTTTRSAEEILCEQEIDEELWQLLSELPEQYLEPLILREVFDESYSDIATILDIPKGTVMSRLSRARSIVRTKLLEKDKGSGRSDVERIGE